MYLINDPFYRLFIKDILLYANSLISKSCKNINAKILNIHVFFAVEYFSKYSLKAKGEIVKLQNTKLILSIVRKVRKTNKFKFPKYPIIKQF